ncbi:MAG: hypothetical protein IH620_05380 [Ignavibacterium sp.]|nr:hypothetical protein [Ignavibacterium sp.]
MKKKINIPLIFVTIIIWGIIIYSVAEAVWFNAENEPITDNTENYNFYKPKENSFGSYFEFERIEHDPFGLTRGKKVLDTLKQIPVKAEIKQEEPIIQFSVGGVLINGDRKKIVFNDETNSNVVFLNEGDSYQGLKVIKVTKKQVEFMQISSGNKLVSQIQ